MRIEVEAEAEDAPADRLQPGERIASRHRVERLWRNHPLGELYRCVDEVTGKPVLLHRLRREFAEPGVGDRLLDTRGRATLDAALLPDLLDYGVDLDGRPFLVGPWLDATPLGELGFGFESARGGPLGFAEALALVTAVAAALTSAHAERLVHGGIEPASLLVQRTPERRPRLVAVLGFGLVPALDGGAEISRSLPLLSSPAYAAPELIAGASISPAADVYALGVVLWELIHGKPPFAGPTLRVLDGHLNRPLPERPLPAEVPPAFDLVLRRMLAKNPVDRFPDAAAVVEQLRSFASAPASAPGPTLGPTPDEDLDAEPPAFEAGEELVPREVDADELDYRPSRAPKLLAALTLLTTLVTLAWIGLSRESIEFVAEDSRSAPRAAQDAQLPATAEDEPETPAQVSPEVRVGPPRSALDPEPSPEPEPDKSIRTKLGSSSFRARKDPLYAAVERHCLSTRIRRTVKVAVRVGPRGKVEAATVRGAMASTALGRCVRSQARKLDFPPSKEGGYYLYTLRLR